MLELFSNGCNADEVRCYYKVGCSRLAISCSICLPRSARIHTLVSQSNNLIIQIWRILWWCIEKERLSDTSINDNIITRGNHIGKTMCPARDGVQGNCDRANAVDRQRAPNLECVLRLKWLASMSSLAGLLLK